MLAAANHEARAQCRDGRTAPPFAAGSAVWPGCAGHGARAQGGHGPPRRHVARRPLRAR
jgi:hypothetical protein